jgi:hypothetical protein
MEERPNLKRWLSSLEDIAVSTVESLLQADSNFLKQQKPRIRRQRADLEFNEWGRMINSHAIWSPTSFEAKKFRSRFRLPWILFKMLLLPACREVNMFNKERGSYISVEYKIMIGLRMLAKDNDCDTLEELTGVPKSTVNIIFNQFCKEMNEFFFDKFVNFPEGAELKKIMDVFARVGFPGAVGSMDATHFRWWRCPAEEFNFCKGKYPYATLAVQAVVDHNRRILYLTDVYDGRENDKTITLDDPWCYGIMHNGTFDNIEYKMYDKEGVLRKYYGAYFIVDGGYHKMPCFIDPMHDATEHLDTHWSEFLESVRKDVECTFGILKSRFRYLRNGLDCTTREKANNIIKTCAILHNMLLTYDGLDEFTWQKNTNWDKEDPNMSDDDLYYHQPSAMNVDNLTNQVRSHHAPLVVDTTPMGRRWKGNRRSEYEPLRKALVMHLYYQWMYGQLDWPMRFSPRAKKLHPMKRIGALMNDVVLKSLYEKRADIVLLENGLHYDVGKGLFSSMLLPSAPNGVKLCSFKGDYITKQEYDRRVAAGRGGYCLLTDRKGNDRYLDCYRMMLRKTCLASKANTALNAFNLSTQSAAVNNCSVHVRGENCTLFTKKNTSIPANRELLWAYQTGYVYPTQRTRWSP